MKHLLLIFVLIIAGCACPAPKTPAYVMDTLYFGGSVSQAEWESYIAKEVTPRFPDGLTNWPAEGQWREAGAASEAVAKEGSQVLQILHAPGSEADAKLNALIEAFKIQFKQKSVLRVRSGVEAEF